MNRVKEEDQPPSKAEVPEGDRDDALFPPLGGRSLDWNSDGELR